MKTRRLNTRRGSATVLILAAVALLAIAFAVYWFALRGGGGEASKLISAHIPAEADIIGGLDVDGALKSDLIKGLAESQGLKLDEISAKLAEQGIKIDQLKTLAFGAMTPKLGAPPSDFVAVAKGTFDASALKGALNTAKVAAAAKGIEGLDLSGLEILDGGLVIGGSGSLVAKAKALSAGEGRSADDNAALKGVREAIDEGATFWMAGPIPEGMSMVDGLKMMGGAGGDVGKPTHFALSADLGADLGLTFAVRFDGDVGKMVSDLSGMLAMAKAFSSGPEGKLLESLDLSSSGPVLIASLRVSPDTIKALTDKGGLPF